MNKILQELINEAIVVELSGKSTKSGTLIDVGSDTIVLFNGFDYIYIPIVHIQHINLDEDNSYVQDSSDTDNSSFVLPKEENDEWSLRKVLTQAKGIFVEIYVTGNQPLHGYITSIMNNYFVFHSPVYKTMYITINHLKWLIPYPQNQRPYGLEDHNFPVQMANLLLSRTFEVQLEKCKGKIIILNIGEKEQYIGKLIKVIGPIVELKNARSKPVLINLQHIKTLQQA
ncbi:hypothetical protein [Paucisalibacillus globulus]|uniref:hypothetical protein n=1 Tax=Paucisalibacillus globulus TaxID=351095 RepID=UPI000419BDF7|nr:hypothetical protein [Paucisalibacillus globulus]